MESNRALTDNDELAKRPVRQPDYAAENKALVRLAKAQAGPIRHLWQEIAEAALAACEAGSAGISLIEGSAENRCFKWQAVAGVGAALQGTTIPWNECPCAIALQEGKPQLFIRPQLHFPYLRFANIDITEGVVVPIGCGDAQLGAIWVMSHSTERQFDSEDVRLLSNLAVFAGSALTVLDARDSGIASDQRHNEFIAMLGHELRNPIAPIDSAIGAAMRLCADNARAVEVLNVAHRQMRHLRTLVDDLLDAARLKHGKLAIKYSDTSLNEIAFDAIATVKHHFESRRHTLKINGLDSPVPVRADHVRLSQVLGNILSNAAKYTPVGGAIEMTVRVDDNAWSAPDGAVTITVKDNGIGIVRAAQPHVFELFAQCARGHARAEGGLGIGLAVAKRMVELHGGTIALQSEGAGKGTVVTLRLPVLRGASAQDKSELPVRSVAPGSVRILLVDDNPDALISLRILLELEGHEVSTAGTGRDAIRLVAQVRPEVAIVDVGLPDVDGFDVARAVRSDPTLDDVTLVALTGYAAESDKSRALAAGFDYHLTKPLSLEKLQYLLANRRGGQMRGLV
ncbi:ATP-binding protein [Paraburkholderia sp. CNPSo 3272]|uniref:hybrid sensor histidine kinase/response regulator n=1 Tax=Paraburkholderia sp. CNPSo 3272 TaxID=2940931 RepID=UPI0020B843B9|nr:ATP-binding protein [Paraburkholderia sp. CNPSo 3272]MCP3722597.1 ATP-binding protein [Paraburkholderia sp. CNPSo 3272]